MTKITTLYESVKKVRGGIARISRLTNRHRNTVVFHLKGQGEAVDCSIVQAAKTILAEQSAARKAVHNPAAAILDDHVAVPVAHGVKATPNHLAASG